jgi:hypothetical protein
MALDTRRLIVQLSNARHAIIGATILSIVQLGTVAQLGLQAGHCRHWKE